MYCDLGLGGLSPNVSARAFIARALMATGGGCRDRLARGKTELTRLLLA